MDSISPSTPARARSAAKGASPAAWLCFRVWLHLRRTPASPVSPLAPSQRLESTFLKPASAAPCGGRDFAAKSLLSNYRSVLAPPLPRRVGHRQPVVGARGRAWAPPPAYPETKHRVVPACCSRPSRPGIWFSGCLVLVACCCRGIRRVVVREGESHPRFSFFSHHSFLSQRSRPPFLARNTPTQGSDSIGLSIPLVGVLEVLGLGHWHTNRARG